MLLTSFYFADRGVSKNILSDTDTLSIRQLPEPHIIRGILEEDRGALRHRAGAETQVNVVGCPQSKSRRFRST